MDLQRSAEFRLNVSHTRLGSRVTTVTDHRVNNLVRSGRIAVTSYAIGKWVTASVQNWETIFVLDFVLLQIKLTKVEVDRELESQHV